MALLGRLGRRLLPLALVLSAFVSVVASRPEAAGAAPATQPPQGYVLVDANRGCQLAGKSEHQPFSTASTAKLLTAVTALERLPLDSTVPVSALAARQEESKINMKEGQVWKLDDAIHSLLIVSANDAAFAIAERAGGGDVAQFAKEANATAKQLGAQNTVFGDPAGLDDRTSFAGGTHMSAYDLAVVARNALAIPEIADTVKLLNYSFTDPTGTVRDLTNHNKGFLTTYPGAIGMKTGFTKAASRTLVTAATRSGRTMIAVVMGTWDDTGWAGYLLDQGFASAAGAPCPGAKLPPVRAVTADTRRQAFEGLPPALGTPALDGGAAATVAGATTVGSTPSTTKAHAGAGGTKKQTTSTSKAEVEVLSHAQAASATTASSGGSGFLGSIFNLKVFVLVIFVVLLTLFLLRRRAVRRQRARRIARQKQMAEIRRRRMIDVVEPIEPETHVKVVPTRRRTPTG